MKLLMCSMVLLLLLGGGVMAQPYDTQKISADTEMEALIGTKSQIQSNIAFVTEARIGDLGGNASTEINIHDARNSATYYILEEANRTWSTSATEYFEVIYTDNPTPKVTYYLYKLSGGTKTDEKTLETTDLQTGHSFSELFIRSRAANTNSSIRVHSLAITIGSGSPTPLSGESYSVNGGDDLDILHIKNVNYTSGTSWKLTGQIDWVWSSPTPDGSNLAMQIKFTETSAGFDWGDTPAGYPDASIRDVDNWQKESGSTTYFMRLGTSSGNHVDTESGTQNSSDALGDDSDGNDDEDGITFASSTLTAGTSGNQVTVDVYNNHWKATPVYVSGWIDFNQDQDFDDPGEQIVSSNSDFGTSSSNQSQTFTFPVPSDAVNGDTYARFILNSTAAPISDGENVSGEIEDYKLTIEGGQSGDTYDWGDLPDDASGTAPGDYETLSANGGPSHVIDPNIYMGYSTVDDESDGQPTGNADGDDNNGTTPDDEDGPQTALTFTEGEYALVTIAATNNTGSAATLYGFIDWNGDGDFNDMHETASVTVPDGSSGAQVKLNFDTVPTNAPSSSYARFRLSTDNAAANPTGQASDGEVEDFPITINDISTPTPIESSSCVGALLSDVVSTDPPTSFPDPGAVGAINGRDNAFNVSVGGDFYVGGPNDTPPGGREAEGRVLVLGDLVINTDNNFTYSMGFVGAGSGIIPDAGTDHVTVGGSVYVNEHDYPQPGVDNSRIALGSSPTFTGGSNVGNIRYKGTLYKAGGATPAMDGDWPDPVDVQSGILSQVINDITLDMTPYSNPFTDLETLSSCWALFPQSENVSITRDGSDLVTVSSTNGASGVYVLNITTDYFAGANSIVFSNFPDDATILFNMNQPSSGETFNFDMSGTWTVSQALRLRILWHFPDAATVNFTGSELWGSVYVANSNSTTTFSTSSINGRVAVAGDLRHQGNDASEFHNYPFQGELPCECGTGDYDWGDNPDTGNSTGTGNYLTLNSDNGPRHEIVPGLFLGSDIDAEGDGQPTTDADGDDNNGTPDDEDGVTVADLTMSEGSSAAVRVNATNTTGGTALLVGFVDFNKDGDFGDAGERVITTVPDGSNNAQFTLNFTVPSGSAGTTYARFRLSRSAVASLEYGECFDGEVEDYEVTINGEQDWGDLPDTGPNTNTGDYQTQSGNNGPRHGIISTLKIGATVDAETDGQQSTNADGDDTNGATPDDEDGVNTADLTMSENAPANIRVTVTNTTGAAATLYGFVDFNKDGDFDDANETASVAVADGSNNAEVTLSFGTVSGTASGSTYARFRLSTDPNAANATGAASDGEVEDYRVTILNDASLDWGDLPDTGVGTGSGNYQTQANDNGPRHGLLAGLYMGGAADAETNGQQSVNADGDDNNGSNDEDGVVVADLSLTTGSAANVRVNATNTFGIAATIYGFIDFNGDGDFDDTNETASVSVPNGSNNVQFTLNFGTVPNGSVSSTYARFRLGTDVNAANPDGAVQYGEVEDYPVDIEGSDWGDAPDTYKTTNGAGGPSHIIVPGLTLGSVVDSEADGQPTTAADGDDTNGTSDDEDGAMLPMNSQLLIGTSPAISVTVTNTTGNSAVVSGWIDLDGNGSFDDATERATVAVNTGATNKVVSLNFAAITGAPGTRYMRFRVSTDGVLPAGGSANDGEVEDYRVDVIENTPSGTDYGDAPTSYGDAFHNNVTANLQLIASTSGYTDVDGELMSQYSGNASGDDNADGSNDENGVENDATNLPSISTDQNGQTYTLDIGVLYSSGTGTATLVGWIDFDQSGTFDASEAQIITGITSELAVQEKQLTWTIPSITTGTSFARFRLTTDNIDGNSASGAASDGEVEDYPINFEDPISVSLATFTATYMEKAVHLEWQAAEERNHAGYNMYRSTEEYGQYHKINEMLIVNESQESPKTYEYLDPFPASGEYFYKLEDVSLSGASKFHGPIQVATTTAVEERDVLPTEFNLVQNYPNPFNPVTTISYTLPHAAEVTLVVYNLQGKVVRTLVSSQQAAGAYNVVWDARDDTGISVTSGLYIYRIQASDYTKTLKMTLLK